MDKNAYMDHLLSDLETKNPVSLDNIESVLGHIGNLHNTMGKSYDYIASGLLKALNEKELEGAGALKSIKDQKNEIAQLKSCIESMEEELAKSKERISQLQKEGEKKDDIIHQLNNQLDLVNTKISASPPIDFSYMKARFEKETPKETPKEITKEVAPRFEMPFHTEEPALPLKRKYDDLQKSDMMMPGVDEENEDSKSSSTLQKKGDESANFDDFKFKKDFKKVKRSENKKENGIGNSTSTPIFTPTNLKRKADLVPTISSFEADSSLQNLLNNFLEPKEALQTTINNKKRNSDSSHSRQNMLVPEESEKLVPSPDSPKMTNVDTNSDTKTYNRKGGIFAFSQKSPLKSLEDFEMNSNKAAVPITRNGRIGTNSNLMQRMIMGNKKRNSIENNMFKMSSKREQISSFTQESSDEKNKGSNENEELVRATYRSKAEREGLQGFDCNECTKFYNFIADGTHIKSAAQMCDKCSRHRGKFALPSTPEKFHENFSLNTQD